jgi:2-methylcitrate dehydratase PrpD
MSQGLTQGLGEFIADPGFEAVPQDLQSSLRNAFIDTLACLLSGRSEPVTVAALQVAAQRAPVPETGVLLTDQRLAAPDAAFVNAVAAHALDLDDMALRGHPSVVLVPALLAAGEACGAPDDLLLRSYLVGYEVWAELLAREPDSYHAKGWHPTGVLGTVAVAAAIAHLEGLPARVCAHAVGIAASLAGGLMGNFGSMTKPLHAGWAASHGIEAVRLAAAGITASPDILERQTGFLGAFSPQGRADRGPWTRPAELRFRHSGLSIKKYPVCYAAHRVVDGMLALRDEHGFTASQIDKITVTVSTVNARVLHSHHPATGLEGKFSIEFTCAMAACDGALGLAQVTDQQVTREDVQRLISHVHCETVAPGCPIDPDFALHDRVQVQLTSGEVLDSGPIRFARGHSQLPLSDDDIRAKFDDCARMAGSRASSVLLPVLERLDGSRNHSVCDWMRHHVVDYR